MLARTRARPVNVVTGLLTQNLWFVSKASVLIFDQEANLSKAETLVTDIESMDSDNDSGSEPRTMRTRFSARLNPGPEPCQ